MTNKIFIDSSILVEKLKGRQVELYEALIRNPSLTLYINQIVLSEFSFHLLAVEGGKAPLTLKRDKQINSVLKDSNPIYLLRRFSYVEANEAVIPLYLRYMQQYNLLPNDALILATCKLNGIEALASYDVDFATACTAEDIRLVQAVSDLTT